MNNQELQERNFENMCLFFKPELLHIHNKNTFLSSLSPASRKTLKVYGVLPNVRFGYMSRPYLTDKAVKFLGLKPRKKEAIPC